jgi:ferredoxin
MPTIIVKGEKTLEVEPTKRLVLAIEDGGIDILHICGGNARCTTCRVNFFEGEPERMTVAERDRLQRNLLLGKVRLSCQILCDHDMTVQPVYRLSATNEEDAGDRPKDYITPEPVWIDKPK